MIIFTGTTMAMDTHSAMKKLTLTKDFITTVLQAGYVVTGSVHVYIRRWYLVRVSIITMQTTLSGPPVVMDAVLSIKDSEEEEYNSTGVLSQLRCHFPLACSWLF